MSTQQFSILDMLSRELSGHQQLQLLANAWRDAEDWSTLPEEEPPPPPPPQGTPIGSFVYNPNGTITIHLGGGHLNTISSFAGIPQAALSIGYDTSCISRGEPPDLWAAATVQSRKYRPRASTVGRSWSTLLDSLDHLTSSARRIDTLLRASRVASHCHCPDGSDDHTGGGGRW